MPDIKARMTRCSAVTDSKEGGQSADSVWTGVYGRPGDPVPCRDDVREVLSPACRMIPVRLTGLNPAAKDDNGSENPEQGNSKI